MIAAYFAVRGDGWGEAYFEPVCDWLDTNQVALSDDEMGDAAQWLSPGLKIQAEFYEGAPIGIDLPPSLELTVTQTEPGFIWSWTEAAPSDGSC